MLLTPSGRRHPAASIFRFALLACLWCWSQCLFGQKASLTYIPISEFPIPSKAQAIDHYDLIVGPKGFVYSAGPSGINRFDGHQMTAIPAPRTPYLSLFRDANQQVWAKSMREGLYQILPDTVLPYPYNDTLRKYHGLRCESQFIDTAGTLFFGTGTHGICSISPEGKVQTICPVKQQIHGIVVAALPNGELMHYTFLQPNGREQGIPVSIYYQSSEDSISRVTTTADIRLGHSARLAVHPDGHWTLSNGSHELVRGRKSTLLKQQRFPYEIHEMHQDAAGDIWLGTYAQGLLWLEGDSWKLKDHLLKKSTSAVVAESEDGTLWIKSSSVKLACIPAPRVMQIGRSEGSKKSPAVGTLLSDYERLLVGLPGIGMVSMNEESWFTIPDPVDAPSDDELTSYNVPTATYCDVKNKWTVTGNNRMIGRWDGQGWTTWKLNPSVLSGGKLSDLKSEDSTRIWALTYSKLFLLEAGRVVLEVPQDRLGGRLLNLETDEQGLVWVGTDKGLKTWDGEHFERPKLLGDSVAWEQERILNLLRIGPTLAVIARSGKVWLIRDKRLLTVRYADGRPVLASGVTSDREGNFWFVSQEEVPRILKLPAQTSDPVVEAFHFSDHVLRFGMTTREPLAVVGHNLYLGNQGGLFKLPIAQLETDAPKPEAYLQKVMVNYHSQSLYDRFQLEHDQDALIIEFGAMSFRLYTPEFRYRMSGLDTSWRQSSYPVAQFTNLPSGNYTFEVQARLGKDAWGKSATAQFFIATPFWETWWFLSLMGLLLMGLVTLGVQLRLQAQRQKTDLEIQTLKAEQKALRSQMNPHFVYNALNSAQKFLLLGQTQDYNEFITRLSGMMRSGLEYSRLAFIPLEREVDFLDNYLKIETQRFPERFDYSIELDEALDADLDFIALPPLLIQPLCENTVKHAYGGQKVHLTVALAQEGSDTLRVRVEDNGVGYRLPSTASATLEKSNSLGLNIVKSRVALLEKQGHRTAFHIGPANPKTGKGTLVELLLPIQ
ncbi:MAG: histidine kinase [Salibacteraceae bacterium]